MKVGSFVGTMSVSYMASIQNTNNYRLISYIIFSFSPHSFSLCSPYIAQSSHYELIILLPQNQQAALS